MICYKTSRNMDVAEVHMSANDIFVVLHVCESLDKATFAGIDIPTVINSLKSLNVIDSEKQKLLLQCYEERRRPPAGSEHSVNQVYAFLSTICAYVPFFGFCAALEYAGYIGLSRDLLRKRDTRTATISCGVLKRELPNAKRIQKYYTHLKRCADNNFFENQTFSVLSKMIDSLSNEICLCTGSNKLQLLVDKRCVLYFLLCQQCSCVRQRNDVLKKMRDSMPLDVDRTVFDTIFHSYMAFNWAISGNAETAEKHENQARIACHSCVAGFVCIVMAQWSQYRSSLLYLHSKCKSKIFFNHAKTRFEITQQYAEDVSDDDEQSMWKTISVIDIARASVGIHTKFEVCDISTIDAGNIEYANRMLDLVSVPRDVRRRLYYFVIRGRLLEMSNRTKAKEYIKEALELAGDGCYDENEKNNIRHYLKSLEGVELPCPSMLY